MYITEKCEYVFVQNQQKRSTYSEFVVNNYSPPSCFYFVFYFFIFSDDVCMYMTISECVRACD